MVGGLEEGWSMSGVVRWRGAVCAGDALICLGYACAWIRAVSVFGGSVQLLKCQSFECKPSLKRVASATSNRHAHRC